MPLECGCPSHLLNRRPSRINLARVPEATLHVVDARIIEIALIEASFQQTAPDAFTASAARIAILSV